MTTVMITETNEATPRSRTRSWARLSCANVCAMEMSVTPSSAGTASISPKSKRSTCANHRSVIGPPDRVQFVEAVFGLRRNGWINETSCGVFHGAAMNPSEARGSWCPQRHSNPRYRLQGAMYYAKLDGMGLG